MTVSQNNEGQWQDSTARAQRVTLVDASGNPVSGGGGVVGTSLFTTPGSGTYIIPASATMILFDATAPGGGGGGGSFDATTSHSVYGGGGGGGGGRTTKWVEAAALRAQYPSGIPYTVQGAGTGGAAGVAGTDGGFIFCDDFFVAVGGKGGGKGGTGNPGITFDVGYGGPNGTGDTYGGFGGGGGGYIQETINVFSGAATLGYAGGAGGTTVLTDTFSGLGLIQFVQLGGAGGGGGGGGISPTGYSPGNIPWNGGTSGFATTADPTPLAGTGGIVGGAGPTAAGNPHIVASGVAVQGGGGGGAAAMTTAAQAGASALALSGSGGGGGGSTRTGTAGVGGNGANGYLRITAF